MTSLRYLSLFSGVGGFDLGFDRAGMVCAGQVEYDEKARAVLAKHWPDVKRMNDVREVQGDEFGTVDVITGGFPCQDVSVAGRRAGLAGERSGLWFEFHRIIERVKPGWVVIENVPGLLSSHNGRDFAVILRGLVECGYGVAWRVLDAQYFGVPQRRRRVFIIGYLGDGRAAQVLFERESGGGDIAEGRSAGKDVAYSLRANPSHSGDKGDGGINTTLITPYVMAHGQANAEIVKDGSPSLTLNHEAPIVTAFNIQTNDGGGYKRKDRPNGGLYVTETKTALTVGSSDSTIVTTFNGYTGGPDDNDAQGGHLVMAVTPWDYQTKRIHRTNGAAPTLAGSDGGGGQRFPNFATSHGVRRLTPVECERLQGFPDGHTAGQSDSARYRQMGNAVAVPVVEWIGRRIVEAQL